MRLLPAGFLRSVATVSSGTVARHALLVLSAPILSRLYSPTDFGVLALLTALLGFLQPLSGLRYELAIPIAETERDADALTWMSIGLTAALASVVGVAAVIGRAPLSNLLNAPALADVAWALPALVASAGTYEALSYLAVRRRAYGTIATTKLTQGVGNVAASIGLGALRMAPLGLIVGDILGRGGGIVRLGVWAVRTGERTAVTPSWSDVRRLGLRYRRFPVFSVWVGLASGAAIQVLPVFLSGRYEAAAAGFYMLAARTIEQPLRVFGSSISQVYMGEAAEGIRERPRAVRTLFMRLLRSLAIVAVVPFGILLFFGPALFAFVFGDEWRQAGRFAQLAAPMFAAQFVTSPLSQTLTLLERQDIQLGFGVIRLIAIGVVFLLTVAGNHSSDTVILGYSIVNALAYAILAGLGFWFLGQRAAGQGSP